MAYDPQKAFISDMTGIFAQHSQMWTVSVEMFKILITVSALPILAAGILLQAAQEVDLSNLPTVVVMTLFFTPAVAFLIAGIIMQHRFVILFYARALNRYRAIYSEWVGVTGNRIDPSPMPVDATYPANYEPVGPTGLIIHGTGIINGLYLGLGVYSTLGRSWAYLVISFVIGLTYLMLLEWWYKFSSRRALP
jgi:hypothetical protein